MLSIIGLGNPGKEYQGTRHNAGFQLVDLLAKEWGAQWQLNKKFSAEIAKVGEVFLLKPTTFMNASGTAVRSFLEYYADQLQTEEGYQQLYLAYDDLDIELGQHKIQFGKAPKIHNGVNSVIQHLHSDQFWNIRLGVDGRQGNRDIPSADYVLTPFSRTEKERFDQVLTEVAATMKAYVPRR